jgi:hypothetical protein
MTGAEVGIPWPVEFCTAGVRKDVTCCFESYETPCRSTDWWGVSGVESSEHLHIGVSDDFRRDVYLYMYLGDVQ